MKAGEQLPVPGGGLLEEGLKVGLHDVESLVAALKSVIADDENRRAMGRASLQIIQDWSYERCRLGVRDALAALSESQ